MSCGFLYNDFGCKQNQFNHHSYANDPHTRVSCCCFCCCAALSPLRAPRPKSPATKCEDRALCFKPGRAKGLTGIWVGGALWKPRPKRLSNKGYLREPIPTSTFHPHGNWGGGGGQRGEAKYALDKALCMAYLGSLPPLLPPPSPHDTRPLRPLLPAW